MSNDTELVRHDNYPPGWPQLNTTGCAHAGYVMTGETLFHNPDPKYIWNEKNILADLKRYIDSTYSGHYGKDSKFQATEVIDDAGHGEGFMMGNIIKYAKRYGKKDGHNKRDLQKIIHYAVMMLHIHERDNYDNSPPQG